MKSRVRMYVLAALLFAAVAGFASSCNSGGGMPTYPSGGGGGTAKELDSGDIGAGGTYAHQFNTAGTFAYHCIHHVPMTGSVTVSASATDLNASVSITSSSMAFPAATVKPGGTVTWTNNTGVLHTVTSN